MPPRKKGRKREKKVLPSHIYLHKHTHSNSFLSGVYYIDASEENDKITFFKDGYKQIKLTSAEWNWWNSESWWVTVKTGQIVVFPSHLTHMVEQKAGNNVRCSLAFNTFLKGTIGENESLTELCIGRKKKIE